MKNAPGAKQRRRASGKTRRWLNRHLWVNWHVFQLGVVSVLGCAMCDTAQEFASLKKGSWRRMVTHDAVELVDRRGVPRIRLDGQILRSRRPNILEAITIADPWPWNRATVRDAGFRNKRAAFQRRKALEVAQ